MFYGLRLLSTTRAFRIDCRVKLIGVSIEEGGVTSSLTDEENGVAAMKTFWCRPPLNCSGKAVGQLKFGE